MFGFVLNHDFHANFVIGFKIISLFFIFDRLILFIFECDIILFMSVSENIDKYFNGLATKFPPFQALRFLKILNIMFRKLIQV